MGTQPGDRSAKRLLVTSRSSLRSVATSTRISSTEFVGWPTPETEPFDVGVPGEIFLAKRRSLRDKGITILDAWKAFILKQGVTVCQFCKQACNKGSAALSLTYSHSGCAREMAISCILMLHWQPVKKTLEQRAIPRQTFYRGYDRFQRIGIVGLEDRSSASSRVWNRIPDDVRDEVIGWGLTNRNCRLANWR